MVPPTMKPTKVMVAHTDAHAAAQLVARVQRLGHEAVCFTRTAGVVNAIIDHRPDWLLVDVDGAAADGPALCDLLRSAPMAARIHILLLGARSAADMRDLVLRCRAQGYLLKEASADGVAMKLDALIRRRVPAVPERERERLAELRSYNVLDTASDEDFDGLTRLASHICGTPVALMSLVDWDRTWFKSRVGYREPEVPRSESFCAHAIHGADLFEVQDASKDDRFAASPSAAANPPIRFYAGAPLVTSSQEVLGTLCVFDLVPRQLAEPQRAALRTLARLAMRLLDLKKRASEAGQSGALPLSAPGSVRS